MILTGTPRRPRARTVGWSAVAARGLLVLTLALPVLAPADLRGEETLDDRIRQRILTRLAGQVSVKPERLQIEVTGGTVRLEGTVASVGERKGVERIVGGVIGVAQVVNDLIIRPSGRSEAAISQEVRRLLDGRTRFRTHPVEVVVAGGEVTLSGEVARALDRLDAETIAGNVEGVTRVVNDLRLAEGGAHPPEEIRRRVLSLLVNPLVFGAIRDLRVEAEGGRVTLRGSARRMEDRLQAERLALTVSGVVEVVNAIEVGGS